MSTEQIPPGFAHLGQAGSHIAYTYHAESERQDCLFAYISAGLRNREKCIAAVPEYTADFWMDGLRMRGIESESVPDGQLEILTASRLLRGSAIHALDDTLGKIVEPSAAEGWQGTRICTGLTDLYHHKDMLPELFMTECRLNDLIDGRPITLLCTFDSSSLHPRLLETCLRCHPIITDGTSLTHNHAYQETAHLLDSLPEVLQELDDTGALIPPFALLDFCNDMPLICAGDEMDFYTAPRLEELADRMVGVGHRRLVVDLSGTSFMDAASIHALARIALNLKGKGGRLAICDPVEPPRKIFGLVGFHELVPICRRLDEAIQAAHA